MNRMLWGGGGSEDTHTPAVLAVYQQRQVGIQDPGIICTSPQLFKKFYLVWCYCVSYHIIYVCIYIVYTVSGVCISVTDEIKGFPGWFLAATGLVLLCYCSSLSRGKPSGCWVLLLDRPGLAWSPQICLCWIANSYGCSYGVGYRTGLAKAHCVFVHIETVSGGTDRSQTCV